MAMLIQPIVQVTDIKTRKPIPRPFCPLVLSISGSLFGGEGGRRLALCQSEVGSPRRWNPLGGRAVSALAGKLHHRTDCFAVKGCLKSYGLLLRFSESES